MLLRLSEGAAAGVGSIWKLVVAQFSGLTPDDRRNTVLTHCQLLGGGPLVD